MRKTSLIIPASFLLFILLGAPPTGIETSSQASISERSAPGLGFTIVSFHFTDFYSTETDASQAAGIISEFDIAVVSGVLDETARSVIDRSIKKIESRGLRYEYLLLPATGLDRHAYVFIYRTDVVYPVQWYRYDDLQLHSLHGGSYIVRFEHNVADFDFTVIARQFDVRHPTPEIDTLRRAVGNVQDNFPDEADIIVVAGAPGICDSVETDALLNPLTDEGYIRLFYDVPPGSEGAGPCPNAQFIVAAYSNDLFWEAPEMYAVASASIESQPLPQPVSEQPAGFSAFIIVKDEDTEDDSDSKAGCFFVSSSS
ncbi:MAG TPA: hypothetical protein ACFCUC_04680 [Desulfobacterales bacterium]